MRKAEKREIKNGRNEYAEWMKVCRHFFPDLAGWFNDMADPRDSRYITYPQAVLILMCVMKCISAVVTMRGMNASFNEEAAIRNLGIMADYPGLNEMPDWQTANNYFERLSVKEVEEIRRRMIGRLLRSKQFDRYKFKGCWKIIIDGTGVAYFRERHCEHDLVTVFTDEETGAKTTVYYHKVLEAKLALSPNVIISIDTEFIENENAEVTKQDCEINASKRLLDRLKENYPKLPILILADGLYATMPFMGLCKSHGFHYILNLKEGRQKTLYEDFKLLVETDGYRRIVPGLCGEENGTGAYRNSMEDISDKEQKCNVFEYRHTVVDTSGEAKETIFVWVTDLYIRSKELEAFIYTGRSRWKIENEGFNNQKNGIYKIEHLCSKNSNAMKIHYLITQLADMIMQLYLAFDKVLIALGSSIKNTARRIGEFFWNKELCQSDIDYINKKTALRLYETKT